MCSSDLGGGRVGEPRISLGVQVGVSRHPPGGVGAAARSGRSFEVVVALFGGVARWSFAADLPPLACSQLPGAVLRALPSPVAVVRRRRAFEDPEGEDLRKHGVDDGGAGWRPYGFEVRRLPVRRETHSDPRRHGRSSGGAPAARSVHRLRPRDPAGPDCNFVAFLGLPVRTVFS